MARKGVPEFPGLKITQDPTAAISYGLRRVTLQKGKNQLLVDEAGVIGWGGNSGFHALNLAVQFGAARIVLVGFDMTLLNGIHWHGPHPSRLNNPTGRALVKWAEILDAQAPLLAGLGVEVLNASPVSALAAYPKVSLEEALASC
jgi:hypothetical protein